MMKIKKYWIFLLAAVLFVSSLYGLGRLYYRLTGGFTESNISYDLPYDSRWETHVLSEKEQQEVHKLLDQHYTYLGKGCQSYVFMSEDGQYVLKFFKYQRFRPQAWLSYVSFLPGMDSYLNHKILKKREKLDSVFLSWKIAYEDLQQESAVAYVHLNKSQDLKKQVVLYDKIGLKHELDIDNYEFMIQRRAHMLCPTLTQLSSEGKIEEAKNLLRQLVMMIVSEYQRGYADNDHALMQNTGVLEGKPIHIDVGQFVKNPRVKSPDVYYQEIFNKTWKFRKWLEKHHPELAVHVEHLLQEIMGKETFSSLKPQLNKAAVGIISHEA